MATTQDHTVGTTPVNLVATLTLTVGIRYNAQVAGAFPVYMREGAATPGITSQGYSFQPGEHFEVKSDGTAIWAWTDRGESEIVLTEA